MKTSKKGQALIQKWESCKLEAYMAVEQVKLFKETGIKEFTIGYGATYIPSGITLGVNGETVSFNSNSPIEEGMYLNSKADANALLDHMIPTYEKYVNDCLKVKVSQDQFDALVSFTFNIGGAALSKSTCMRVLNQGNYALASAEMGRWDNVGPNEVKGLENRRVEEMALFNSALNTISFSPKFLGIF